jgi:hypothetical protein
LPGRGRHLRGRCGCVQCRAETARQAWRLPAEQITAGLDKLSRAGIDGCLLFWVDFEREQRQFIDEVLPLMVQAGLRKPRQRNRADQLSR